MRGGPPPPCGAEAAHRVRGGRIRACAEADLPGRLRFVRRILVAAIVLAATLAVAAPGVQARPTIDCKSADLRYPFMPGGPKTFGVFKLKVTGGSCTTAHRVAKTWMAKFEANINAGSTKLPKTAAGFTVTSLPVTEAQTSRLRARKGTTSIRFDYVVPNG
jgi:hypothetical protein